MTQEEIQAEVQKAKPYAKQVLDIMYQFGRRGMYLPEIEAIKLWNSYFYPHYKKAYVYG